MRHFPDAERRLRIARRHAIAPYARVQDPLVATRAMTVLHATEPASVHLALHARVAGLSVGDVDSALYDERSLVKQLAMRRTLFVFPRDLLPAAWGSASARVAAQQRTRLAKDVAAGLADDGPAWVDVACAAVLNRLVDGSEVSAQQLREELPELAGRIGIATDAAYGGPVPVAPRVLTLLGAEGLVVRGHNGGHWRVSRPQWTLMSSWLGALPEALDPRAGYAELVRRWLTTFGPGTSADLQWWLGSTGAAVKQALADVEAVAVGLDRDDTGWVLPDDLDESADGIPDGSSGAEPWAALLPVLDPTVMGWKNRDFYLGPHAARLFDRNGNAGTTAWWCGQVVGAWVQDAAGVVEVRLVHDVPVEGRQALTAEAERLTRWLQGQRVGTVYPSPLMQVP